MVSSRASTIRPGSAALGVLILPLYFLEIVCCSRCHRRQDAGFGRLGKGREKRASSIEQLVGEPGDAA